MFTKTRGFLGIVLKVAYRAISNQALISTTKTLQSHNLYSASPSLLVKRRHLRRAFSLSQVPVLPSRLYSSEQIEDFSSLRRRLFISTNLAANNNQEYAGHEGPDYTECEDPVKYPSHTTPITHCTQHQQTDQSIDNIFPFLTGEELKVFDPSIYQ